MIVELRTLGSNDGEVFNYKISFDGLQVGRCQIRRHFSKSEGMPAGYENNFYYDLSTDYQSKEMTKALFDVSRDEAELLRIPHLIGILMDWEIEALTAVEELGGGIVGPEITTGGQRIFRFTLPVRK